MNNEIIPQGPQEIINGGNLTQPSLLVYAETDLVITNLVFSHPKAPAHANAVNALTLGAGRYLCHVKSMTFTGLATVIYRS